MSEVFRKYITNGAGLSAQEVDLMLSKMIRRRLQEKQFLLREGEQAHYQTFVEKGLLRAYRINENGDEHIIRFGPECYWMGDQTSMRTGEPSKLYIDAIEDSDVLLWPKEDFETFLKTMPKLKAWSDQLLAKSASVSHERIFSNISLSAEEKYLQYLDQYPAVAERIPLYMLAAYLGVTRETLSRIRKKMGH